MQNFIPFIPLKILNNGHVQSIAGNFFNLSFPITSEISFVTLPDGDQLAMEINTAAQWREGDPIITMLHGLCGSSGSSYLIRIAKKFLKKGYKVIRMNMRNCGPSEGLCRQIYHSGCSQDMETILRLLKKDHPTSKMVTIGFSLGGNVLLKLAGELKGEGPQLMDQLISICPPIDLVSSVKRFQLKENRIYEKYFLQHLMPAVLKLHEKFPELPKVKFPKEMTMLKFDQHYVVPRLGLKDTDEYYEVASAKNYIPHIQIPTKILHALDDPIVDGEAIDQILLPPNVQSFKTTSGGHNAWLGSPFSPHGFRMLDRVILDWSEEYLNPQIAQLSIKVNGNNT